MITVFKNGSSECLVCDVCYTARQPSTGPAGETKKGRVTVELFNSSEPIAKQAESSTLPNSSPFHPPKPKGQVDSLPSGYAETNGEQLWHITSLREFLR